MPSPIDQDANQIVQLKSKRILLQAYGEEDCLPFLKGIRMDRKRLVPYFSKLTQKATSLEGVKDYFKIKNEENEHKKSFTFGIFLKQYKKLAGQISVRNIDWSVPKGELGFFIFSEFSGHNYGAETLELMVNWCYAENTFERIYALIGPENLASIKTVKKCNFKKEGTLKNAYRKNGRELSDMELYARTK